MLSQWVQANGGDQVVRYARLLLSDYDASIGVPVELQSQPDVTIKGLANLVSPKLNNLQRLIITWNVAAENQPIQVTSTNTVRLLALPNLITLTENLSSLAELIDAQNQDAVTQQLEAINQGNMRDCNASFANGQALDRSAYDPKIIAFVKGLATTLNTIQF